MRDGKGPQRAESAESILKVGPFPTGNPRPALGEGQVWGVISQASLDEQGLNSISVSSSRVLGGR